MTEGSGGSGGQGEGTSLRARIDSNPTWYHTIELAPGVSTPGHVDMRPLAERVLPDDLSGRRALDVGTFDGFWAFELERRGAEVVAIDVDEVASVELPPVNRERLLAAGRGQGVELGRGFRVAAAALGSGVERIGCNVYDLTPERVGGDFDLIFSGAILLHLRDPVRALENMHRCLRSGGEARVLEPYSLPLSILRRGRPAASFEPLHTNFNWWVPNLAGLRAWMVSAGFSEVSRLARLRSRAGLNRRMQRARYALMRGAA